MPNPSSISPEIHNLILALDDTNAATKRVKAAVKLGELKCLESVSDLEMCLSAEEPNNVRAAAAEALGQIGDQSCALALIAALQERGFIEAIHALDVIGNPIAIRFLIGYFVDRDSWAFDSAHGALFDIGVESIPALVDALNDSNPDMRFGAVLTLGRIGRWYRDQRVVAPLVSRWNDPDDSVRDLAVTCVAELGELADEAVLKMLEGGEERKAFAKEVLEREEEVGHG